jgi:hypothetical protein
LAECGIANLGSIPKADNGQTEQKEKRKLAISYCASILFEAKLAHRSWHWLMRINLLEKNY